MGIAAEFHIKVIDLDNIGIKVCPEFGRYIYLQHIHLTKKRLKDIRALGPAR